MKNILLTVALLFVGSVLAFSQTEREISTVISTGETTPKGSTASLCTFATPGPYYRQPATARLECLEIQYSAGRVSEANYLAEKAKLLLIIEGE